MLDRPLAPAARRPRLAPQTLIGAHLAVFGLAGFALVWSQSVPIWIISALAAGTSLFACTGLIRDASHRRLASNRVGNDLLGMLIGWATLTPLSAYRLFQTAHLQATNQTQDPNHPLNSRWMLAFGAPAYVVLVHWYAIRTFRGREFFWYGIETVAMIVTLGLIGACVPHEVCERAFLLPLVVAACWRNFGIVAEHLDLPSGRFLDTWQLALPAPLSRWLLHADHHLEQHLRPSLCWHELPVYRAEIVRGGFVPPAHQITVLKFARLVVCKRRPVASGAISSPPRWAGRAAIRARPRQPNHPPRGSVV